MRGVMHALQLENAQLKYNIDKATKRVPLCEIKRGLELYKLIKEIKSIKYSNMLLLKNICDKDKVIYKKEKRIESLEKSKRSLELNMREVIDRRKKDVEKMIKAESERFSEIFKDKDSRIHEHE